MPVKPSPTKYTCQQCGWQGVAKPASDALSIDGCDNNILDIPADYYSCCPKCKCKALKTEPATFFDLLKTSLWG